MSPNLLTYRLRLEEFLLKLRQLDEAEAALSPEDRAERPVMLKSVGRDEKGWLTFVLSKDLAPK